MKQHIELASITSRWTADEDDEMFRVVPREEESGKNEEEKEDVRLSE